MEKPQIAENRGRYYTIDSKIGMLRYFVYDSFDDPIANQLRAEDSRVLGEAFKLINFLNIPRGSTVLDIGANLGVISLPFAKSGYKVFAFEASKRNCEQLQASIKGNNLNAFVIQKAIVETAGIYRFIENGPFGHLKNTFLDYSTETYHDDSLIQGTSLDEWYEQAECNEGIRLIKIDVEGGELGAIKGMKKLVAVEKSPLIYMEINTWCLAWNGLTAKAIFDEIKSAGYWPYLIKGDDTLVKTSADADIQERVCMSYLMINNDDEILRDKQIIPQRTDVDDVFFTKATETNNPLIIYAVAYTMLKYPRLLEHPKANEFIAKLSDSSNIYNKKIYKEICEL